MNDVRLEPLSASNIEVEACCCMTYDAQFKALSSVKRQWLGGMMKKGLRGQIIFKGDVPLGFIEYQPIELAPCPAVGKDLFFVNCLMVHLWDLGPGKMDRKGYGRMLVEAAEKDIAENTKAKGLAAWGYDNEYWFMPYKFFRHLGYEIVDREEQRVLLVKKFGRVQDPKFRAQSFTRDPAAGKAIIDFFYNGQCPFRLGQLQRWRKISQEYGEDVIFNELHTDDSAILNEHGISSGLFVNGEQIFADPMTDEDIRDRISRAIRGSVGDGDSYD